MTIENERPEVDLLDVLRERVVAGEPIIIAGKQPAKIDAAMNGVYDLLGRPESK